MISTPLNINSLWSELIISELIKLGIDYFCICPGSRSTPLTVSVARNPKAKDIVCYDERGAAFHALGYARGCGKSAAVITTSGTAVANLFPAVIEASMDNIPMLLLTADRPPELQDTGANQTIDQKEIFGKYVRKFANIPCPDENIPPENILTLIDSCVYQSKRNPPGPVHLNLQFREPLAPVGEDISDNYYNNTKMLIKQKKPFTEYTKVTNVPGKRSISDIANIINRSDQGIITAGRLKDSDEGKEILRLANKLKWPVFPDVLSGLRFEKGPPVINYFDLILLSDNFFGSALPDTVLHFGGQLTSKRFLQFIENNKINNHIVVKEHPYRHDPANSTTLRVESDISSFCKNLDKLIKIKRDNNSDLLLKKNSLVEKTISSYSRENTNLNEPVLSRVISQKIRKGTCLFISSSLPIREMDMYSAASEKDVITDSNRGVSGIDGTIASASGFAEGSGKNVTLITGDLAFLHDINSLNMIKDISTSVTIIVINNRGGGIFSFLPISEHTDVFEKYFGTPHSISFKNAADMFGLEYHQPKNQKEFSTLYSSIQKTGKSAVIEVLTDRKENFDLQQELQNKIRSVLI
ncbi:2-succinyl-5-enolpyruvyl-6-hydroxy-3-cyclohexene-1-carboxylic-acid synthase [candidate division KSB1 bacterium]